MMKAYDEYLEFLTSSPTLEDIVGFRPSDQTLARVQILQQAREAGKLSDKEKIELREYYKADYFMQKIKIRAKRKLHLEQTPY